MYHDNVHVPFTWLMFLLIPLPTLCINLTKQICYNHFLVALEFIVLNTKTKRIYSQDGTIRVLCCLQSIDAKRVMSKVIIGFHV